ncbi:hypothetical protein ES703_37566 [subsurface metagenome]
MIPVISKHRMVWRIRVTFAGKLPPKEYMTPDIRHNDPGWASEILSRPIEMLEFFLPTGHRLVMSGMEQYNFFVEAVQSTRTRGGAKIQAFWFCGKLPSRSSRPEPVEWVEMWRVGDGKIIRDRRPWGREWGGGPTRGWKPGVNAKPVSMIMS